MFEEIPINRQSNRPVPVQLAEQTAVVFWSNEEKDSLFKRKELEGINAVFKNAGATAEVICIEELKRQRNDWWNRPAENKSYDGLLIDKEITYLRIEFKYG